MEDKVKKKKLCIICEKRETTKDLQACSYCGAPDKITLYCAGCDNVQELDYTAIKNLQRLSLQKIHRPLNVPAHIKTGIIVKLTNCDKCPKPEKVTIMIFMLGKDDKIKN